MELKLEEEHALYIAVASALFYSVHQLSYWFVVVYN